LTSASYNHFIHQHFKNFAPWSLKWSIWFAEALSLLVKNDLSGEILSNLKSKNYHEEALTFLQINYYLSKAGFDIQFEKEVIINGVSKFPDLRLENPSNREVMFLELSSLHMHQEHDWNRSMFHHLTTCFHDGIKVDYAGTIKNITKENFESIKEQIIFLKQSAIDNHGFLSVENDNLIVAVAASESKQELISWCEAKGVSINSLHGDTLNLEGEMSRIKKKVQDKASQLSRDFPNVIGISMNALFMMAGNKIEMLVELVSYIARFEHIYGVLVFGENPIAQGDDCHLDSDGVIISRNRVADLKCTEFWFSKNPNNNNLSEDTMKMFYDSFKFGKAISL
jgi:hypothetical protein